MNFHIYVVKLFWVPCDTGMSLKMLDISCVHKQSCNMKLDRNGKCMCG